MEQKKQTQNNSGPVGNKPLQFRNDPPFHYPVAENHELTYTHAKPRQGNASCQNTKSKQINKNVKLCPGDFHAAANIGSLFLLFLFGRFIGSL